MKEKFKNSNDTPVVESNTVDDVANKEDVYKMRLAEGIFNSVAITCGKRIASIPIDLLNVDYDTYQRDTKTSKLLRNWDVKKCSLLIVNYRRSEKKFYVIDGATRKTVAKMLGIHELACEIFDDLSIREEALMFATQYDAVNKLTPYDKYKAYLRAEIPSYVSIDKTCKEFSMRISRKGSYSYVHGNEITAIDKLVKQVDRINNTEDKEKFLRFLFDIYKKTGWNKYNNGLNTDFFVPITSIYFNCKGDKLIDVSNKLVEVLSQTDPITIKCVSILRYRLSDHQSCIKCLYNDIINGNVDTEYILRYTTNDNNILKKRILEYCANLPCDNIIKSSSIAEDCNMTKNTFNALIKVDNDIKEVFDNMILLRDGSTRTYKVTGKSIDIANKFVA